MKEVFWEAYLKWFCALQQFLDLKDLLSAWIRASSYFCHKKKNFVWFHSLFFHACYGKIMNPSNTFSPFLHDSPPFWHKNSSKFIYLVYLVLVPRSYCAYFLYWIPWTFFYVWYIWEKLAFLIFLFLGYHCFSVGMLRRNNVILFATRGFLAESALQGCLSFQVRVCIEPFLNSLP